MTGSALEVVTGRAVSPGAGPAALTPNTGNTFAIRSTPNDGNPFLLGVWAQAATAGLVRVRSPRMHDFVQGIRYAVAAGVVRNLLPDEARTQMYSQDTFTFEIGGGAAETDSAAVLIHYPQLGGVNARLAMWEQIKPNIEEITTVEVAVAGPAVAGDWSAGTAINATSDLLKANEDYAILGYSVDTACLAVGIASADTGNLRVGGPAPLEPIETRDWFISLAKNQGLPMIPVINQANKGSTLISVAKNTAAGTVNVDLVVARLSSPFAG